MKYILCLSSTDRLEIRDKNGKFIKAEPFLIDTTSGLEQLIDTNKCHLVSSKPLLKFRIPIVLTLKTIPNLPKNYFYLNHKKEVLGMVCIEGVKDLFGKARKLYVYPQK